MSEVSKVDDRTFWAFLVGAVIGGIAIGLFFSQPSYGYSAIATPKPPPKTVYTNTEEWEVIRNSTGSIDGIRIKRKAEET